MSVIQVIKNLIKKTSMANPRTRALFIVGMLIISLTLFFMYAFINAQKAALADHITTQRVHHQRLMQQLIDQTRKSYQSRLKSLVTTKKKVIDSFARKDRDALYQNSLHFQQLFKKENPYFQTIFFINEDNTAFLRVFNPNVFGDKVKSLSLLVMRCNQEKKPFAGFEIVKVGPSYRVVQPVFSNGKHVGVVGFGLNALFFMNQLSETARSTESLENGSHVHTGLIFSKKDVGKMVLSKEPHKIAGDFVIVAQKASLFASFMENRSIVEPLQQYKIGDATYVNIVSSQFKNSQDETIAWAVSLINVESSITETRKTIQKTILLSISLLLLVFAILYFSFDQLFRKISRLTGSLAQSNKLLEARVEERTEALKKEIKEKEKIENELQVIFKTIPDPIVVYDERGFPQYLNPAFTRIFNWSLDELREQRIPFVPDDQKQLTLDKISEIINTRDPVRFESKRLTKSGELLDIFISAAVLRDSKDEIKGIVVNLKDITQLKTSEMQLRQSQKMEAVGTLAGGIAHDFNNILSAIFGYAQLAEMQIDKPEEARKKIHQMIKAAERASDLVQQILTVSRHKKQHKEQISLFLIVKEAVKFLRSSIPSTISIDMDVTSRSKILANPGQAHQVIMNICTNAAQAMEQTGGTLSVSLKDVQILEVDERLPYHYTPGMFVMLKITDTGCGMKKYMLEKIFNPYFTTKEAGKGTGLGLAVVDGIIKKHHGYIKTFSTPGKGSSFEIFWPVIEGETFISKMKSEEDNIAEGSENILLVDDESNLLETTQQILERFGYKVFPFQDGAEALSAFQDNPDGFDLVVTDMTMPEMTGDKLAQEILKIRKEIPIILCTGFSRTITREKAYDMGIKYYLKKPFIMKDLQLKIRGLLDTDNT